MKVFVYGTLKRGYHNNALLQGSVFLEEKIIPGFKLLDSGFPVAVPDKQSEVSGELYEIDDLDKFTLLRLDRLESEGRMYNRIEVEPDVHMYVGNPPFWDNFKHMEECPSENNRYNWER